MTSPVDTQVDTKDHTPSYSKIDLSPIENFRYPTSKDPYFGCFSLKELRDEVWFESQRVAKKIDRYHRAEDNGHGSDVRLLLQETQRYYHCVQICFAAARSHYVSGAYHFAAQDTLQTIRWLITSCNEPGLLTHHQYIDTVYRIAIQLNYLLNNKILIYALTEYGLAKLRTFTPNLKGSKLIICAAMMMDPNIEPPKLRQDIFSAESKFQALCSDLTYVTKQANFIAETVQAFEQVRNEIWKYLLAPSQQVTVNSSDTDVIR